MSRFNDFIQFNDKQFDDVDKILEFNGLTCDVFRPIYNGNPGFDSEVGEPKMIKRMLVHLSRRGGVYKSNVEGGISSNRVEFIGLCADNDVSVGDIWRIEGKKYTVVDIDFASKGKTEVRLNLLS